MSEILAKKNDLVAFRAAIRDWLKKVCPPPEFVDEMEDAAGKDHAKFEKYQRDWMAELTKVGLATPHWPQEFGGAGLSLKHLIIVSDEMARAYAPRLEMYVVSLNHLPPTLLAWGNEKQKAKYLPGVAQRGTPWCQGFSEPGAGSDLASLRTRAELVGNEYVINGQKIWSSQSMHAEYCILLARTDPNVKKQAGLTYFLMDMKAPGVEVRPIKKSTGRAEFSELFLTDVRIPVEDRLGEENKGWSVAATTLAAERGMILFADCERFRYRIEGLYKQALEDDAAWLKDDQHRREFMRILSRLQAVRGLIRELLEHNQRDPDGKTIAPPIIKFAATSLEKDFFEFLTRVKGGQGQYMETGPAGKGEIPGNPMLDYVDSFGRAIGGGTSEIMLNMIAERGLGMPRD